MSATTSCCERAAGGSLGIVAVVLGKRADSTSSAPDADGPARMPRRVLSYEDRQPADRDPVTRSVAERGIVRLDLAARARGYVWKVGGQAFPDAEPIRVRRARHVRFAAWLQPILHRPSLRLPSPDYSGGGGVS